MNGNNVRNFLQGYQEIGIYRTCSGAAHWDGKHNVSETVASGVYFYTLTEGDFSAIRKMLVLK